MFLLLQGQKIHTTVVIYSDSRSAFYPSLSKVTNTFHVCFINTPSPPPQALCAEGSGYSTHLCLYGVRWFLFSMVLAAVWSCWPQEGTPNLEREGAKSGEVPCSSDKWLHCLAAPGRANHTALWQGQLQPVLNLTTNITIIDPEHGIRGRCTSCWRRGHLHLTNPTTLQMLCETPHMPKHNWQWANLTWHTKTG